MHLAFDTPPISHAFSISRRTLRTLHWICSHILVHTDHGSALLNYAPDNAMIDWEVGRLHGVEVAELFLVACKELTDRMRGCYRQTYQEPPTCPS